MCFVVWLDLPSAHSFRPFSKCRSTSPALDHESMAFLALVHDSRLETLPMFMLDPRRTSTLFDPVVRQVMHCKQLRRYGIPRSSMPVEVVVLADVGMNSTFEIGVLFSNCAL